MTALYLSCKDTDILEDGAEMPRKILLLDGGKQAVSVIGPADASVARISDVYRKVLYLKSRDQEALIHTKERLETVIRDSEKLQMLNIQFDMNPMNGY